MNKTRKKNVAKSVWIFFIVIILIIILGLIVTSLIFKNPDVTPSVFGYSAFIMDEDGMGSNVPEGSLVIAKNYSPSADNLGDAILCEGVGDYGTTVIRLSNIIPNTKTVVYQGFFDNDKENVFDVSSKNLIGKAVSYNVVLGRMITFVTSNMGRAAMVTIPILMLLVCEGFIGLFSKNAAKKKQKEKFRKKLDAYNVPENSPLRSENINSNTISPVTIDDYIFGVEEKRRNAERSAEHAKKKPVKASDEKKDKPFKKPAEVRHPRTEAEKAQRKSAPPAKQLGEDKAAERKYGEARHNSPDKREKPARPEDRAQRQGGERVRPTADRAAVSAKAESIKAAVDKAEQAEKASEKPAVKTAQAETAETAKDAAASKAAKAAEKKEALPVKAETAPVKKEEPKPKADEAVEKKTKEPTPEEAALQESKQQTEEASSSSLAKLLKLMEEQEKMLKEKSDI